MAQTSIAAIAATPATGYSIVNHILHKNGAPVAQKRTPNIGGKIAPSLLIMHYTAGFTAASAIATLCNPKVAASAHLVIDRDGTVTQFAPLNIKTWHAGDSAWKGRRMCNGFSIGIEFVNCGPLLKRADGALVAEVSPKKVIAKTDAIEAHHPNGERTMFWQLYPQAQVDAGAEVARAICDAYGIKDIAGHYDIAPKRKRDPGPAFPMASIQSRALGRK